MTSLELQHRAVQRREARRREHARDARNAVLIVLLLASLQGLADRCAAVPDEHEEEAV